MRSPRGSGGACRRKPVPLALAASALLLAAGCAESSASDQAAGNGADERSPERTVVAVVDFSGSQTSHAVGAGRQYLEKVIETLSFGDRLILLEMYRTGSRDSVGRFVQDMPEPVRGGAVTSYDRRELQAARRGVLNALPIFFDPNLVRSVRTTDLLTTMHIAAEHLRDAGPRERELIILSDMLQSTPRFEFEDARRMPPEGWVSAQDARNLLPSLEGTCVLVMGADHTTSPGQRVREFWFDYFTAAGATLPTGNYRLGPPTDAREC